MPASALKVRTDQQGLNVVSGAMSGDATHAAGDVNTFSGIVQLLPLLAIHKPVMAGHMGG
jgi:hypothetical protein